MYLKQRSVRVINLRIRYQLKREQQDILLLIINKNSYYLFMFFSVSLVYIVLIVDSFMVTLIITSLPGSKFLYQQC